MVLAYFTSNTSKRPAHCHILYSNPSGICNARFLEGKKCLSRSTGCLQIQLTGIPHQKGLYNVTGCTITLDKVSWHQRWLRPLVNGSAGLKSWPSTADAGGIPEVRASCRASTRKLVNFLSLLRHMRKSDSHARRQSKCLQSSFVRGDSRD